MTVLRSSVSEDIFSQNEAFGAQNDWSLLSEVTGVSTPNNEVLAKNRPLRLAFGNYLVDTTNHVKRLLWIVVHFATQNCFKACDGVF